MDLRTPQARRISTKHRSPASIPPTAAFPKGQTYHAAGATDDGWVVVALWDSRESWESFRDETLMPGFQALGDAGLPAPPQSTEFEIHKEKQGS